ncbi:hypothetical protein MNEG_4017 [Monoraphidium neglectum]|uniref:Uncharacterized protein n=1 Tax=Monoraphidium neglectum TaxID=145388 RepID=A0A0D2MTW6_9CHLO|nr:hypothetical protein MNEG_4017 [Monoraphidium neglectum]KIZ03937.1 hypothetical protein MNEG_4017 [Monoraphidium neglectum]|eukprot:XP_013902956.1 hypothetical protein MNEG_4017 [Monoraphidium neglectum]
MAEEPLRSTESPSGSRRRHGARHPAGAEEDWELSSDDERAAGAGAVMTAGGSPLRRARAPVGKRRSLAEIEGYPTWSEDLPALLDLSLWRQGVLASRSAALVALMALLAYSTVLAPAALPSWRDEARLALTLGYQNAVVFSLMAASALQPLVMAPLMMPAMRSANKVPLWPFLAASPLLGSYALLSYLAVFKPPRRVPRLPPGAAELSP